jgi:membrane-associated protein
MLNQLSQLSQWLDPLFLIQTLGLVGVIAIIFAESGLLIGIFFPGDSLLFTAGFLASQGYLNIWLLVPLAILAAIVGDSVGFWFGTKVGPKIFYREDSWFFHKKHLIRAKQFYEQHGKKAIILARFMPVLRTLAPILAGVGQMNYRVFLAYNIIGGLLWAGGVTLIGFTLGSVIPGIDRYLWPIIAVIILSSFVPVLKQVFSSRQKDYNKE